MSKLNQVSSEASLVAPLEGERMRAETLKDLIIREFEGEIDLEMSLEEALEEFEKNQGESLEGEVWKGLKVIIIDSNVIFRMIIKGKRFTYLQSTG